MPDLNRKNLIYEDPFADLKKNPEFRKADRKAKPYFDLVREIVSRRTQLGLTQNDLAKLAETFQSRISNIEAGKNDPRLSTIIQIAEALKTTVELKLLPFDDSHYSNVGAQYTQLDIKQTGSQKQDYSFNSENAICYELELEK
jgi:transcriptional regulator with XRE-family HTH domain